MTDEEIHKRAVEYAREPAQARFMDSISRYKGRGWVWNTWLAAFTKHCHSCKPHQVPDGIRVANEAIKQKNPA